MGRFEGQTVFITGASAGIGKALALAFAAEGADIAVAARRKDKLEAVAAAIQRETGRRALPLEADVTKDGSLEAAAQEARDKLGRIDVVVANAGFGVAGPFEKLDLDDYRRQFETNIFGVIRTLRATLADVTHARGRFAIVGSVASHIGVPGTIPYSMSKAAIASLAQGLRLELADKGVSVTLLSPGFIDSEIRLLDNQGAMKENAKDPAPSFLVMPTAKAARQMVDAVARREAERVITMHGKLAVSLARHAPNMLEALLRRGGRKRSPVRWDKSSK
jgi:short-subunit dehydrogenase